MPKRLRDDVMCFRLQIHSRWMMTHWRAQSQRSHLRGPTPRTIQEDVEQITTNEDTEVLHSSTTWVRRNIMRHGTARDHYQLLFRHSVHVYIHWSNFSLSTRLAVSHVLKTYLSQVNYLSHGIKIWTDFSSVLSQCTRLTDGRTDGRTDRQTNRHTDRNLIARPRLHSMHAAR